MFEGADTAGSTAIIRRIRLCMSTHTLTGSTASVTLL